MKRLLLIGVAACAVVLALTLSASAMPGANPSALTDTDSSIILVKVAMGGAIMAGGVTIMDGGEVAAITMAGRAVVIAAGIKPAAKTGRL
jgi:hypothetical protein